MAKKTNLNSRQCKEFELDLTDYVTGDMTFLTKEKQQNLFEHLRKCPECQKQLWSWKATHSVLKGRYQSARPEARKKLDDLIERVKRELVTRSGSRPETPQGRGKGVPVIKPLPGEKFLDNEAEIGSAARKLWHYLYGNGRVKMNELRYKVKLPTDIFYQAVGWLARENQIHRTRVKKSTFVYLAPAEIQKHQAQARV